MITKLNLASRPFRNRKLPYLISLLLTALAMLGITSSYIKWRDANERNELALRDITKFEAEIKELNGKGDQVQKQLPPDKRQLLIAAHKLVANKSFGWSRLFADLESILPGNVSTSRISVENIFKDGDRIKAQLEFAVLSRDYQSVLTMIDNMNSSGIFVAELRSQDRQEGETVTFTEYTLNLIYTPSVSYSPSSADFASTQGGTE